MRFIFSACCIVLKRSISVILSAVLCFAIAAAVFSATMMTVEAEPIKIAIVNQDDTAMLLPLVTDMLESRLNGLLKAELCENEDQAKGYAAVLILPNGFFRSVMNGENIAPKLTVNTSSPFEGVWISSLANSAAKLISSAQNIIGAVNVAADNANLSVEERDKIIISLNGYLLNDYLTRKGRFESITLSSTGALTAKQYYLSAAVSFFSFIVAFMLFVPIKELQHFATLSNKRWQCMISSAISCLVLSLLITSPAVIILGTAEKLCSFEFAKMSLLLFSIIMFLPAVCKNAAGCASLCCAATLFQTVLGGFILPEALLPHSLAAASQFFPLSVFRKILADTVFNCGFSGDTILFTWCFLLTAASVICWMRKGDTV